MPRPKRHVQSAISDTLSPPASLPPTHRIARVLKAAGNNQFSATLPCGTEILLELPAKFRNTIWIKRGSYVVFDTEALAERENKLDGEIVNVVGDEKAWRSMAYWPAEFAKKSSWDQDSEDDSNVGKLPPTDSD